MTVIAMTREIGSQGILVATGVAAELGLEVINAEIVPSSASTTLGVEHQSVQRYVDGSASLLERWRIDKKKLSRHTSEEIFRLGQQGNALIRGWGAGALLRDVPQVLSVRICAPMSVRERVMMERLGVKNSDVVREEIERYDAVRSETMRDLFNINRGDALLYHVVLNTGRLEIDACVKTICDLARGPQFQDDGAMRSAFVNKLLETRVRTRLVHELGIEMATITVAAVDGEVVIGGLTSTGSLPARVERVARAVEGVKSVNNCIKSVPAIGQFGIS
jgi:cytidylate kinase